MSSKKLREEAVWLTLVVLIVGVIECQEVNDYQQIDNRITQRVYSQISNITSLVTQDIGNHSSFCVKDPEADWNQAFNFSSDLDFLASCIQKTKGDITGRMCTAAEVKFYLYSLFDRSRGANYLKPNKNCNLTSWVSGCEPGWACSVGQSQKVDLKNSEEPIRTTDCQSCCEGFFCPHGMTCMIPCPLGSYCPLAELNEATGLCQPYFYQPPPMQPNHTCGGADIWADVDSSGEIFCSAGSYCPTTTQKIQCSSGHHCRMGSTSEKRCFKFGSCKSNTVNQNMHAYGILLIAALSTLLLIVYNCSDQVLTIRERRMAKSRDAAAKNVRKTTNAQQIWKAAKDAAANHVGGLHPLSDTISSNKDVDNLGKVQIVNQAHTETDIELLDPPSVTSNMAVSFAMTKPKGKESRDLVQMMYEIENDSDFSRYFDVDATSYESVTGNKPKGKELNTHSQIFKYAYAQLEKEKARQEENKELTFSRVIRMAANSEQKKRPLIEISFKDLTVTLKAQNKNILRCVTGKIKPGRVTAVMGPSGAGKTTFLSALAGTTFGCTISGSILINGKNESINCYKKIIGFVPQDDIVHGNLTVEENLWFSAKCRLSGDLSRADQVLVVERVIEFLGLQSVRSSLVGTVERRGISGGQRKRVNVGLEMVMEPSLLILDEPTSGLDSSSSQLLLRSLRREALEGVNICMVVHQPSYALFKMFDDLVLLAKGGLTVYHGSVKKVEEYFAGLGIEIPEKINPPDYFIDILEGIVVPSGSLGVSGEELPVRWMVYNGYQVPLDMQKNVGKNHKVFHSVNKVNEVDLDGSGDEEKSFAGELWQDVKHNVVLHGDKIRLNFFKSKDFSNRTTPGLLMQYRYFLGRVVKQRLREAKTQAIDYLILLLAGACLGILTKTSDETFGAAGYTFTVIAVSLLCKIAALRSFSLDKLQYSRESNSGMSSLAYFLAKDTIDHFNTVIKPVVYLSMFYSFTNPRSTFEANYIVLLCLVYCVTGIAYALAIFFEPGAAQLWSVLIPVVLTLVAKQAKDSKLLKDIANLCYTKWALEAFIIANAERYPGVWLITRCGSLMQSGYNLHDWSLCIIILIGIGITSRAVAYLCLITFRNK